MLTVPYFKMNYVLLNCKKFLWDTDVNFCFSFREYVKSQIQFPLTPTIYKRDLMFYKEVYLFLEEGKYVDRSVICKVLRFFYEDLFDSFRTLKVDSSFYFDYTGILDLFPPRIVPNTQSCSNKLTVLHEASLCNDDDIFLLIIGGDLDG